MVKFFALQAMAMDPLGLSVGACGICCSERYSNNLPKRFINFDLLILAFLPNAESISSF